MDFLHRSRRSSATTGSSYQVAPAARAARAAQAARQQAASGRISALIERPRHAGLFEAIHRLDMDIAAAERQQLAEWIREEYERELGDFPLGFVAMCHLGPPFIDHRLDLMHSIVDHYAPSQGMPDPFQQARMLVRTGAYEFIEIYASGQLIPVRSDGTPVATPSSEQS
jgi:hypothetical protein